jgi:hypothetical protein
VLRNPLRWTGDRVPTSLVAARARFSPEVHADAKDDAAEPSDREGALSEPTTPRDGKEGVGRRLESVRGLLRFPCSAPVSCSPAGDNALLWRPPGVHSVDADTVSVLNVSRVGSRVRVRLWRDGRSGGRSCRCSFPCSERELERRNATAKSKGRKCAT